MQDALQACQVVAMLGMVDLPHMPLYFREFVSGYARAAAARRSPLAARLCRCWVQHSHRLVTSLPHSFEWSTLAVPIPGLLEVAAWISNHMLPAWPAPAAATNGGVVVGRSRDGWWGHMSGDDGARHDIPWAGNTLLPPLAR